MVWRLVRDVHCVHRDRRFTLFSSVKCDEPAASRLRAPNVNLKKKPYFSGNDLCLTGPD
jgi:hypothetical protein